jgi:adenylate cyclase
MGRIWVDWASRPIEHSLSKLPKTFDNGIVIVGLTAKGFNNPVATSVGAVWPHYFQAAVLDTLLSGTNITRTDWASGAEILSIILIGIILLFLTRYAYIGLISIIVFIIAATYGSYFLYSSYLLLFDTTALVCSIILISLHAYGIKFVSEFLQKQQIKKQFGTYLSPDLVAQLQRQPELLRLGGDEKELSIMFTDVRGFTTISEHYGKDVQGLTKIMNRYMTAMTKKILENKGTLDKYIGDAQMAFWNAPIESVGHAKLAVKTALEMMDSLDDFNKEITAEGIPAFGMGLGINTGTVVVGNMGSDQRFDYTCLGDAVNTASRLEGQSKNYGVRIVLGPETANQVKDEYDVFEMDCIAVKGKKEGVRIYTIQKQDKEHNAFLYWYYQGEWKECIRIAKNRIVEKSPMSEYYSLMLERMEQGKPDDWNGVYKATSK